MADHQRKDLLRRLSRLQTVIVIAALLGVAACAHRGGGGGGGAGGAGGGDGRYLAEGEVSSRALLRLFKDAGESCELDSDGDLKLDDPATKYYVFIHPDDGTKRVSIFAIAKLRSGASEREKLKLAERLNDKLALVKFSVSKEGKLVCDYQVIFRGGVLKAQLVESYRLFVKVLGGIKDYDTDGILD